MEGNTTQTTESQTISQQDNLNDLVAMGFDPVLVSKALQLTNDKERAIELVLKFQDDSQNVTTTTQNPPQDTASEEQKLQEKIKEALKVTNYSTMSYKMVLIVRQDLGMGVGKIAAQVGHAVLGAYQTIVESEDVKQQEALFNWEENGQAKIVLKIKSKEEMLEVSKKAKQAGLNYYIVADAGRTQIEAGSLTVLAVGPASSADLDPVTGHLKLM